MPVIAATLQHTHRFHRAVLSVLELQQRYARSRSGSETRLHRLHTRSSPSSSSRSLSPSRSPSSLSLPRSLSSSRSLGLAPILLSHPPSSSPPSSMLHSLDEILRRRRGGSRQAWQREISSGLQGWSFLCNRSPSFSLPPPSSLAPFQPLNPPTLAPVQLLNPLSLAPLQVISEASHHCLKTLFRMTHSSRLLPPLIAGEQPATPPPEIKRKKPNSWYKMNRDCGF